MDISKACLPPSQPAISEADRAHPRFREYQSYRNGMSRLLVQACSFASWLRQTEESENPQDHVFHTKPGAAYAQGWYKHKFGPNNVLLARLGPFKSKEEAEKAH